MTTRMHADELDIDEPLVRRLLTKQFPEWAALPLRRVEPSGTDNAIFRLGDQLAVRIPRRDGPTTPGSKELEWLPRLAPLVPVEIPFPVAQGRPGAGYPWHWEIHTWVDGETVPVEEIDAVQAAIDLAAIVRALKQIDPAGAPPGRGNPLAERDAEMQGWLAEYDGDPGAAAEWQRALAAPAWDGPPVWHHGELDMRNWLVHDGRITGLIDWGCMGVGDPACDVMVAWKLHSADARDAFREALPTDGATWERARGWALSQAIGAVTYYTPENNPFLYHEGERGWHCCGRSEARRRMGKDRRIRRQLALAAVSEVAHRLGLNDAGADVIADSNNTLVRLPEEDIVAKTSTSVLAGRGVAALERELRLGRRLAEHGVPITTPAPGSVAGPHHPPVSCSHCGGTSGRMPSRTTATASSGKRSALS